MNYETKVAPWRFAQGWNANRPRMRMEKVHASSFAKATEDRGERGEEKNRIVRMI